jgi:hypothetical protein
VKEGLRLGPAEGEEKGSSLPGNLKSLSVLIVCFLRCVCVNCYFLRSPSLAPYRTPPACAKRAADPDPPTVVPHPESIAAQAAYAEALLPGPVRNVSRHWGPPSPGLLQSPIL